MKAINLKDWEVNATLAGRKTQILVPVKPQPPSWANEPEMVGHWCHFNGDHPVGKCGHPSCGCIGAGRATEPFPSMFTKTCPYPVGTRLWVRETWQDYCPLWHGAWCGHGTQEGIEKDHQPVYKADPPELWKREMGSGEYREPSKWRPSTQMPRWASRLSLEVTAVRVIRLNSISEEDALKVGGWVYAKCPFHKEPIMSLKDQWDKDHKPDLAWERSPWAWQIDYTVVEKGEGR
jgi:hypothetical protein